MLVRLTTLHALALAGLLAAVACVPEKHSSKVPKPKVTTPGTPPSGDATGSQQPTTPATDEKNLPAYLMTTAEANAITQLVKPYRQPSDPMPSIPSVARYAQARTTFEAFLKKAMGIASLAPGRKPTVVIVESTDPNAAADEYQRVIINNAAFTLTDGKTLLTVLCHELAHSSLNHMIARIDQAQNDQAVSRAYLAMGSYLDKAYDTASGTYHHNLQAYKQARVAWDAAAPTLSMTYKRQESEADVVGSMLCGQFGMPVAMYRQALIGFLTSADSASTAAGGSAGSITKPEQLVDGDEFEMSADDISNFLFQTDDHPTTAERSTQLQRVADAVTKHFAQSTLLTEWLAAYGLAANGLSLADTPASFVHEVAIGNGRTIIVPPQHWLRPAALGKSQDHEDGP